MRCTEPLRRAGRWLGASLAALLAAACSPSAPPPPAPGASAASSQPAASPAPSPPASAGSAPAPMPRPASAPAAGPAATAAESRRLPPPGPVRDWTQLRLQAAHRMVQANPDISYLSPAVEPLLAIPVLEIELERDGSIRRITVLRQPRQARDTVPVAIAAVRRAAPFGDVSRLPKPWKFVETFLFDDDRRFKPRSLDDG